MNSEIISKAMNLGKKLIDLAKEDGKERRIFFTKDAESVVAVGSKKCVVFAQLPKETQNKLLEFRNEHKNDSYLSDMHSHPFDSTFSSEDIPLIERNLKGDINYSFVVTSQYLFALHVPPNLKYGLKASKIFQTNLATFDKRLWRQAGVKFKSIRLKGGKSGRLPICNDRQREGHNKSWNNGFLNFFNHWNIINKNQLEYEVHELT